ncbi:hypothetical protein FPZ12_000850 [Amycolatopsis acidicola]|uniref:Uncharacterized protein n=1 Tax=Amycolatopsis acidicola TaxID=2596893 RepID=A0A5N0VK73_9PSEU|nr:hypothetical protein [Amycolatopsis acidicola]KAA9166787.1 hypothetical protein FPZ12_000850 [Amycolatopsis acidicola]
MKHLKDDELVPALSAELRQELRAAVYARVDTVLGPARMLSPLGNYFIARPAARAAAHRITERTDVPLDAAMVLGITTDALHIWRADPMLNRVGEHVGRVSLDRITGITVGPARSWQKVTVLLAEGETIEVEGRGAAHALAAAYRDCRAG